MRRSGIKSFVGFVAIVLSTLIYCYSQPSIQWQKSFGGSNEDIISSICKMNDGNYGIVAMSQSSDGDVSNHYGSNQYYDAWILKIDSSGTLLWEKSYGGTSNDYARSLTCDLTGSITFAGSTDSNDSDVVGLHTGIIPPGFDYWIVKIDSIGGIQWSKCFGGMLSDECYQMIATKDSGYFLAGYAYSHDGDLNFTYGGMDYWGVKLRHDGSMQWNSQFGGLTDDWAFSTGQASSGDFLIAGSTYLDFGNYHGGGDIGIVSFDSNAVNWSKCFGGSMGDGVGIGSILPSVNGTAYISGGTESVNGDINSSLGNNDVWVFKIDSLGNIIWSKNLGGTDRDGAGQIIRTSDGGIVINCLSASNDIHVSGNHGGSDSWIIKLDSMGNFDWGKCLGGSAFDQPVAILETNDGGLLAGINTASTDGDVAFNHGMNDIWLVKLSPAPLSDNLIDNNLMELNFYQNGNGINIKFFSKLDGPATITIFNLLGEKILDDKIKINAGVNNKIIRVTDLTFGLYFGDVEYNGKNYKCKFYSN